MKSINEMSKNDLINLLMKYYKSIDNKNDLVNDLLQHFEVDLNSFSKNAIHKMIKNYYNQFSEKDLRKEITNSFDIEMPKPKPKAKAKSETKSKPLTKEQQEFIKFIEKASKKEYGIEKLKLTKKQIEDLFTKDDFKYQEIGIMNSLLVDGVKYSDKLKKEVKDFFKKYKDIFMTFDFEMTENLFNSVYDVLDNILSDKIEEYGYADNDEDFNMAMSDYDEIKDGKYEVYEHPQKEKQEEDELLPEYMWENEFTPKTVKQANKEHEELKKNNIEMAKKRFDFLDNDYWKKLTPKEKALKVLDMKFLEGLNEHKNTYDKTPDLFKKYYQKNKNNKKVLGRGLKFRKQKYKY